MAIIKNVWFLNVAYGSKTNTGAVDGAWNVNREPERNVGWNYARSNEGCTSLKAVQNGWQYDPDICKQRGYQMCKSGYCSGRETMPNGKNDQASGQETLCVKLPPKPNAATESDIGCHVRGCKDSNAKEMALRCVTVSTKGSSAVAKCPAGPPPP